MRTLYLDCGMGAAGDMLTAALLELLPEPDRFVDKLNMLGIPGVEFRNEKAVKCGITGTHMSVLVQGEEEGADVHHHDHEHTHEHDHEHTHEHEHGHVRRKISSGYGVSRAKYEYEDLSKIAHEQALSIEEVKKLLEDV